MTIEIVFLLLLGLCAGIWGIVLTFEPVRAFLFDIDDYMDDSQASAWVAILFLTVVIVILGVVGLLEGPPNSL